MIIWQIAWPFQQDFSDFLETSKLNFLKSFHQLQITWLKSQDMLKTSSSTQNIREKYSSMLREEKEMNYTEISVSHVARTTDAQWSIFSLKSRTFGLEQTNWADKFWSIWEFSAKLSAPILLQWVPLSMFFIIEYTLDLRKILGMNQIFLKSRFFLISNRAM